MKYMIGTRGSRLALTQAEYVCERLREFYPQEEFEIQIIKTRGDLVLDKPLHEIGDRGVFVREIEEKLLSGEIQLGVHSMKDMPARPAPGLVFTRAWKREDPRDVLILREKKLSGGAAPGSSDWNRQQTKGVSAKTPAAGFEYRGNPRECGYPAPENGGGKAGRYCSGSRRTSPDAYAG